MWNQSIHCCKMSLEDTVLSDRSQAWSTTCKVLFTWNIQNGWSHGGRKYSVGGGSLWLGQADEGCYCQRVQSSGLMEMFLIHKHKVSWILITLVNCVLCELQLLQWFSEITDVCLLTQITILKFKQKQIKFLSKSYTKKVTNEEIRKIFLNWIKM